MNQTVTLTRHNSGFANVPPEYTVGDNDDGSDALVSAEEYLLPEGFEVAESALGELGIYGPDGRRCDVAVGRNWKTPSLINAAGMVPLKRATVA